MVVLAALLAPIIAHTIRRDADRFRFRPPQAAYPFGTDNFGRDVLTRVRLRRAAVADDRAGHGAGLGRDRRRSRRAAAHTGFDPLLMRAMDALMALPAILLAIGLTRRSAAHVNVVIALSVATFRAPRASCAARRW